MLLLPPPPSKSRSNALALSFSSTQHLHVRAKPHLVHPTTHASRQHFEPTSPSPPVSYLLHLSSQALILLLRSHSRLLLSVPTERSLTLLNSTTQHAFAPLSITIPSGLSSHNLSSTFITLCSSPCTSSSTGVLASFSATAGRSSSLLQMSGYTHPSAIVTRSRTAA